MPDDVVFNAHKHVTLVPTDRVRILNPRVRNPKTFEEMVESIARIGLKRPITVTQRANTEPAEYDLVCGQGRLEAFIQLKQEAIPAIVIDADESDCLGRSLVENCARRPPRARRATACRGRTHTTRRASPRAPGRRGQDPPHPTGGCPG